MLHHRATPRLLAIIQASLARSAKSGPPPAKRYFSPDRRDPCTRAHAQLAAEGDDVGFVQYGGEEGGYSSAMSIRPDMIGIVARDIEASLQFYRLLDLDVPSPKEGAPYVEVITTNGYRISWNALSMAKDLDPAWVEPKGHRMELAFLCDSPAEVDATYAKIERAGYTGKTAPWDAPWGQRYAIVVDPDGNHVSLFAPLAAPAK